jgi:hypothetical protein
MNGGEMRRAESIEILVIGIVTLLSWIVWPYYSAPIPVWQIVLNASILFLMQSLVRDVAILLRHQHSTSNEPPQEVQCFCLESSVGVCGVIIGALLAGFTSSKWITISRWEFVLGIAAVMVLGFISKDWVISWNPIGLRREKDHLNLIIRWKNKSK